MIHQKDFPFHEPEDETEIIHVDHGHHRSGWLGKIFVISVIAIMIFLSAKALFDFGRGGDSISSGTPVIEPNPEPYKSSPEDPGGMAIPHIDKEIYGKIKMPIEEPIDLYAEEHFKSSPLARMIEKENQNMQEENKNAMRAPADNKPEVVRPEKDSNTAAKTIRLDSSGKQFETTAKTPTVTESTKAKRIDVEKVLAKNAGANEIWLQLGSFKSEEEATKAWQDTREKNSDILKDMTIKVTKSDMRDQGVFYRLQAGSASSEGEAKDLCVKLNARKQQCFYTVNKNNN